MVLLQLRVTTILRSFNCSGILPSWNSSPQKFSEPAVSELQCQHCNGVPDANIFKKKKIEKNLEIRRKRQKIFDDKGFK